MKGGLDLTQDIAMEVFTAALVLALKLGLHCYILCQIKPSLQGILCYKLYELTIVPTISCQPSTSTKSIILNGSEIIAGGSIIIPIAIVVAIVLLLFGPWMMNSCIEFFNYIFGLMATVGAT